MTGPRRHTMRRLSALAAVTTLALSWYLAAVTRAQQKPVFRSTAVNVSVDSVTFRLLDGSDRGGPMITVPKPELEQMFGSTVVVGSRAFAFQPVFGCGVVQARSLAADVVLVDSAGTARNVTVGASVQ